MAIVTHTTAFHAAPKAEPARPGLLRRWLKAVLDSRERSAQRDVDSYVERNGGRLTDSIEREMSERALGLGRKFP